MRVYCSMLFTEMISPVELTNELFNVLFTLLRRGVVL